MHGRTLAADRYRTLRMTVSLGHPLNQYVGRKWRFFECLTVYILWSGNRGNAGGHGEYEENEFDVDVHAQGIEKM